MTKQDKVDRINELLRKSKLKLPSFRNQVTLSGKNVQWLVKHIDPKNSNVTELLDLLKKF